MRKNIPIDGKHIYRVEAYEPEGITVMYTIIPPHGMKERMTRKYTFNRLMELMLESGTLESVEVSEAEIRMMKAEARALRSCGVQL